MIPSGPSAPQSYHVGRPFPYLPAIDTYQCKKENFAQNNNGSQGIKALIVCSLITSLSAVFPLPALPYLPLSSLPFIWAQRGPQAPLRQKGTRGGGEKGAATRGHEKGPYLRWYGAHREPLSERLCCGGPLWSLSQRPTNAWPLFLPRAAFHLLPFLLVLPRRPPPAPLWGPLLTGGFHLRS